MTVWSASGPSISSAGFPGIKWMSRKHMIPAISMIGIISRNRRIMKLVILALVLLLVRSASFVSRRKTTVFDGSPKTVLGGLHRASCLRQPEIPCVIESMDRMGLGTQILYLAFGGRYMKYVIIAELDDGHLGVKKFLESRPGVKACFIVGC